MNLKKYSPWNWLRKENGGQSGEVPVVQRGSRPSHPLTGLHQEIDRLFDQTLREFNMGLPSLFERSRMPDFFRPSLDISESADHYTIKVETPGVSRDDISITVEDDALIIRGEKKEESSREEEAYHYTERSYGSFQRVLALPQDADPDNLKASFQDGVLTITVGRTAKGREGARQIDIE